MKTIIVIPAYNEASSIKDVIQACKKEGYSTIIVVDDGSSDATSAKAESCGALVLRHLINRGVGAATQTGLDAAKVLQADIVVTLDADDQHEARDIQQAIDLIRENRADVIIGSRFKGKNQIPHSRRFFNYLANMFTYFLSGVRTTDSQSGLKIFNKKALEKIYITANGFEFSSEIFREIHWHHLRIGEVPITVNYTPYSLSKGQNFATGLMTIYKLLLRSLMRK